MLAYAALSGHRVKRSRRHSKAASGMYRITGIHTMYMLMCIVVCIDLHALHALGWRGNAINGRCKRM